MEPITLSSDRLQVSLSPPGALYTGSRFDWTTQVRQIVLDGRYDLLTREKESKDPSDQGWGLAGEFGINTAVGFADCRPGELFPKIGVGLLKRPDEAPYHFYCPYEIQPAQFSVEHRGKDTVHVTADQPAHRGYGWSLVRVWSVQGPQLTLTTTLGNTGSHPWNTEEYIHNFFGLEGLPVGPGWSLNTSRPWNPGELASVVDPEKLLCFGSQLTWTQTPTQDFFVSDQRLPIPSQWTLAALPQGLTVSETVDFPGSHFNLWGKGHVISPELYRSFSIAPGSTQTWTRRWTFHQGV